jgi:hypothetical protein
MMFRVGVIESILSIKKMFKKEAKAYICVDKKDENGKYWRHAIHPSYKEHRKSAPSIIPKDVLRREFQLLIKDLEEYFPLNVIKVNGVEADDIVYMVCKLKPNYNNVVITPDKDAEQLMVNPNVAIMNIEKHIVADIVDPAFKRFCLIIKGDTSDGIRNIFSSLEKNGTRQTPVTQIMLRKMYDCYITEGKDVFVKRYINTDAIKNRFVQNRKLIDMTWIPEDIQQKITSAIINCQVKGNVATARNYALKNRMISLHNYLQFL